MRVIAQEDRLDFFFYSPEDIVFNDIRIQCKLYPDRIIFLNGYPVTAIRSNEDGTISFVVGEMLQ